jgi:hypothetical protein
MYIKGGRNVDQGLPKKNWGGVLTKSSFAPALISVAGNVVNP